MDRFPAPVVRAVVATIASSIGLLSFSAHAEVPLDRSGYVDAVLSASLEARVLESEAALERAETIGVGAWANPTLEWQREAAGSGEQRASQDLFWVSIPLVLSGRLGLERDAAGKSREAADARRARARGELRRQALRAYAAVIAARERQRVLEASVAAVTRLAEAIAVRERAGDAAGLDRLRVEVETGSLENDLRAARLQTTLAEADALRLLGGSRPSLPELTGALADPAPSAEGDEPEKGRADLRAWALDSESAAAYERAAARSWIPALTLRGGVQVLNLGGAGSQSGYFVGLGLPLPVFQRGQGEEARAHARKALADARYAALLNQARTQLRVAQERIASRREGVERHLADVLKRAEELVRTAEVAYRGGGAELLVLLDAERVARDARLTAITLAEELFAANTDLLLLVGALDEGSSGKSQP